MSKGYWIAHVDVDDPEKYKDYIAANAAAFRNMAHASWSVAAASSVSKAIVARAA